MLKLWQHWEIRLSIQRVRHVMSFIVFCVYLCLLLKINNLEQDEGFGENRIKSDVPWQKCDLLDGFLSPLHYMSPFRSRVVLWGDTLGKSTPVFFSKHLLVWQHMSQMPSGLSSFLCTFLFETSSYLTCVSDAFWFVPFLHLCVSSPTFLPPQKIASDEKVSWKVKT